MSTFPITEAMITKARRAFRATAPGAVIRDGSDPMRAALNAVAGDIAAAASEQIAATITTHNGTPVTAENLRWSATHPSLCGAWVFDVLMGLADALDNPYRATEEA